MSEPKPYTIIYKNGDRPHKPLTKIKGEMFAQWFERAKPNEAISLHDDNGNFEQVITRSEIASIEQSSAKNVRRDRDGNVEVQGFRCEWGTYHPIAMIKQESCDCWTTFNMHHVPMFHKIRENHPEIHTCTDITSQMQQEILISQMTI